MEHGVEQGLRTTRRVEEEEYEKEGLRLHGVINVKSGYIFCLAWPEVQPH